MKDKESIENIWNTIQDETQKRVKAEPVLASFFHTTILEHSSFSAAIADLIVALVDWGCGAIADFRVGGGSEHALVPRFSGYRRWAIACPPRQNVQEEGELSNDF